MRKVFAVLFLLFLLAGCEEKATGAYSFYYPRVNYTQNSPDSVIAYEYRDGQGYETPVDFLNYYIMGPEDPALRNPFPAELQILNVQVYGDTVYVTVSNHLASLTGTDTILACASLGKTAAKFTGVSAAQIECQTAKLNGKRFIRIDEDNLQYLDPVPQETTAAPTE